MALRPSGVVTTSAIQRYLGTAYDNVVLVAEYIAEIALVAACIEPITLYLGAHTIPPTVGNNGNALVSGNFYVNTNTNILEYYDASEGIWIAVDNDTVIQAAQDAEASRLQAEQAETNAATSASNAATSEANAAQSEAQANARFKGSVAVFMQNDGGPQYSTGDRVQFDEFYAGTGVGGGTWEKTGVTGQTPSQLPAQRGLAKATDSNGHEWELVEKKGDLFRKLGAYVDNTADDYLVVNAVVAEINAGNIKNELLILGSLRCATTPDTITKAYKLSGIGQYSKIFWDDCDGFKHDIENDYAYAQLLWRDFSYTTNANGTRIGVEYYSNYAGGGYGARLIFSNVFMMPEGLSVGLPVSTQEWGTAGIFGDGTRKTSELHFLDVAVYGASVNSSYARLTSSKGFVFTDVTGARFDRPKIFLLGDTGLSFNGQTEGSIVDTATIVACKNGIEYMNLVAPCHNHVVNDSHMGVYERGIKTEDNANVTPLSCFFDNLFILEREESLSKTNGFVGAELYVKSSIVSNTVVWCNGTTPVGSNEKIGYRVSSASNTLDACKVKLTRYALDIVESSDDDYSNEMTEVDVMAIRPGTASLYPGSLTPVGRLVRMDGGTRYQQKVMRNKVTYLNDVLEDYFDIGTDGVTLKVTEDSTNCILVRNKDTGDNIVQIRSNGSVEWGNPNGPTTSLQHDFRTLNADYDVRFNISSGDAGVAGQGNLNILGNNLDLSFDTVNTTSQYAVGGQRIITSRQAAISDSVGGDEQSKINEILTMVRAHGLISS